MYSVVSLTFMRLAVKPPSYPGIKVYALTHPKGVHPVLNPYGDDKRLFGSIVARTVGR